MTLTEILALITGVLQFPAEVLKLVQALKGTPAEQQAAIMASVEQASQNYQQTGRPS